MVTVPTLRSRSRVGDSAFAHRRRPCLLLAGRGGTMRKCLAAVAFLGCLAAAASASAQVYPSRPITMVVPYPPGGPTDTLARILLEPMRMSLGQPIIIENVGGAGGTLGVARAARASA